MMAPQVIGWVGLEFFKIFSLYHHMRSMIYQIYMNNNEPGLAKRHFKDLKHHSIYRRLPCKFGKLDKVLVAKLQNIQIAEITMVRAKTHTPCNFPGLFQSSLYIICVCWPRHHFSITVQNKYLQGWLLQIGATKFL